MSISENILKLKKELPKEVTLVAVSKTKPISDIEQAYNSGQLIFGENKVQELVEKYEKLSKEIQWQMIGHLQRNKVKFIAPFVRLIHGVDSEKLLKEIDKRAKQNNRTIDCLLQVHIATESTKFGFSEEEVLRIMKQKEDFKNINIVGLMGMATFTENETQIKEEFSFLSEIYKKYEQMNILSMGMSGDYKIAIECGSTMVRIGSTIFGNRNY
ncbi:MAG: YggS family pyridoxal phosphate-dependent enzyme [Flavobacteriales bacterium]|jgi:pyridoxal phosphate enzyme (YggS family)|tara:strand:- start:97 stop:735 length:639 start_codon:yes stop_codon:yes gene_type:complete